MGSSRKITLCPVGRLAGVLLVAFGLAPVSRAEEAAPLEYKVKAAFLLNFTRFVEWPASAFASEGAPLTICVAGESPFGDALEQIVKGETVNGHPLAVQAVPRLPEPNTCQVLFVGASAREPSKILSSAGPGVLTVGETAGFLRDGGMIAFVLENRRVRFDIDQRAAAKGALAISSKLLSVARSVER